MAEKGDALTTAILSLYRSVASHIERQEATEQDSQTTLSVDVDGTTSMLRALAVELSGLLQEDGDYSAEIPARIRQIERNLSTLTIRIKQQCPSQPLSW